MFRTLATALSLIVALAATAAVAAPPLAAYVQEGETDWVRLSPSGERYAFVERSDGKQRLLVSTTDGKSGAAFDVGTPDITGLSWAGEDHVLMFTRTTGKLGPEFTRKSAWMTSVFVFNLKTKQMFRVFEHKEKEVGGIVEGTFGLSLIDGRRYGYFGGFNEARPITSSAPTNHRDLYQVDLDSGAIKMISEGSGQGDYWLVSHAGEIIARYRYAWSSGQWQVLAGPVGNKILAAGHSRFGAGGSLGFGRSANEILFIRPAEGDGRASIQTLSLSGALPAEVDMGDDLNTLVIDSRTGLWIGTIKDGDPPSMRFFSPDLDQRAQKALRAFPNRPLRLRSWNDDLTKLVVFTSGSGDSGTYYLVDLTTNKANPIGYVFPSIQPQDVGAVKQIEYRASDGLELHGILSMPPGRDARNLPLVVVARDGLGKRSGPWFNAFFQAIASRGYAVLMVDTRGTRGYGDDFSSAGYGQMGQKIQTDISDGVAALAKQGVVDPKRVCIVGSGWGGYSALAGVTLQQGIYRCAVSVHGISDLGLAINDSEKATGGANNQTRLLQELLGVKSPYGADTKARSPVKLASQADAPVLLIYNKDDPATSSAQSEGMADALTRAGKTVKLVVASALSNDLESQANRTITLTETIAFLDKYNPPDPVTAAEATH